jgi:hypothetical protein
MNELPNRPAPVVLSRLVKQLVLCCIPLYVLVCVLMAIFQRSFISEHRIRRISV